MSIPLLTQVYDETRRLAIAGSVVAGGDFRLKKLIAPLEQAGAKVPVFAKVAELVKSLVDCTEKTSAAALLELCTLVNAVLYTQGETGLTGTLEPLDTTELGMQTTETNARLLKPLLEALTSTGSGRLETIKEAYERGAFRDLRLVSPTLAALDDTFSEIGDFLAIEVLPIYGKAILPELKAKFDMKGRGGHVRRLKLMHQLDPVGTRDTVKQALDSGSKEMKVGAIECLGTDSEDLAFLLEQAKAKSKEVRNAALISLSRMDAEEAVEALKNALMGGDLTFQAIFAIRKCTHPKLLKYLLEESRKEFESVCTEADVKTAESSAERLITLLNCLTDRHDRTTESTILDFFSKFPELNRKKFGPIEYNISVRVVELLSNGTKKMQKMLAITHAALDPGLLAIAFNTACNSLTPAKAYDEYSPYFTAKIDEKKKQKDPAFAKQSVLLSQLENQFHYRRGVLLKESSGDSMMEWDSRWLDLAVKKQSSVMVSIFIRPGHAAANTFLSKTFSREFPSFKSFLESSRLLSNMVFAEHPDATAAVVSVLSRLGGKKCKDFWGAYLMCQLIAKLPKSAVPALEELIPSLHERIVDGILEAVNELKQKP